MSVALNKESEALINAYRQAYEAYANALSQHTLLDHQRHTILALLMKDAEALGVSSAAGQEREARASPEYREHIEALAEATARLEIAKGRKRERELAIDLWRTVQARDRAEIEAYRSDRSP